MRSLFAQIATMIGNIKQVMRLAYDIDGRLVTWYYATAFVGATAPILAGFLFKLFIDQLALPQQAVAQVGVPLTVVVILAAYYLARVAETVIYWGLNVSYYDYLLRNKLQMGLTLRYDRKLAELDLAHLEDAEVQNLITKVQHTFQWQIPDFIRTWNYVFANLIGITLSALALLPYSFWLPLAVILLAIPRIYLKVKHGNFVWAMYGGGAPNAKKLWYLNGLLTDKESILETRIFQSQEALLKKYDQIQNELFEVNKKPLDNFRWVLVLAPLIETIFVLGLVYTLLPQVMTGSLSIGAITFIITTMENMRSNASWGANHIGELYEKNLFIKPFFDLLALPKLIKEKKQAHRFKKIEPPKIEFRHVSFRYPNGRQILHDVSFTVEPGENVALVGVNGAGKTTIIKLLCRFYDVTEGEILVNGVNLKDVQLANWYAHVGTLFQHFVRYNFTIRENIMLGAPKIEDEARMKRAAEQAGAWEFIQKFEKGYDQMLGRNFEDGEELSGGQWQKLAIARAFYEQAPVLILDEPTSAIDAEAEFEIFQNLEQNYREKTLLLVSHRFSTVRNAQKIIVLDQGRIVEQGSHAELLANHGKYASMFTTQAQGYR